jgi:sec-independent protein translocase protein TatB
MFGIGTSELLIIGVVALLFVKPEDLPRVFRYFGRIYGKAKAAYDEVMSIKDQIIKEIDEAAELEEPKTENS